MLFSNAFLQSLAQVEVIGEFPPFTTKDIVEVESYITQLVAKLRENSCLLVRKVNTFSSFIEIQVSKADKSDTIVTSDGVTTTENISGLLLYFCVLAPYWFYGACEWSANWIGSIGGSSTGGSSCFLDAGSLNCVDHSLWNVEIDAIKRVAQEFQYTLLLVETLAQPAPIDLPFETLLSDKPHQVFDYFFYWAD